MNSTMRTTLLSALLLSMLVACGTTEDDGPTDTGVDTSEDTNDDVDNPDVREDPRPDTDVDLDTIEADCIDALDFTCCDGGVEFAPACGRDGWFCPGGEPGPIGSCAEDVGPDVEPVDAG